MLKKRKCTKCNKKISESYRFCPHCGYGDRDFDDADWGMLGKDDFFSEKANTSFGFDNLFDSLMKNLTKQLNKSFTSEKNNPAAKNNGISISISSSGNSPPKIRINSPINKKVKKEIPGQFSIEDARKFSKLQKQEPKTNIRRLSDKVIYEIEMPEVQSIKDVSITRLESSIEIKAIGKTKAYIKNIPLNMQIIDYVFSKEKLILEFSARG